VPDQVAIAGVLDQRPLDNAAERAWIFRTIGRSHDQRFWSSFVRELHSVGYDDTLSIENEDVTQPAVEGVVEAAAFMNAILRSR
jgi:sugar phosphate isomerase/epimerase